MSYVPEIPFGSVIKSSLGTFDHVKRLNRRGRWLSQLSGYHV